MDEETDNNTSSINGLIQMLLSIYWVWHFGRLFYLYHFTDILLNLMYPDWILILFIMMAVTGTFIGLTVFLKRIKTKIGYLILLGLFVSGLLMDLISMS